MPIGINEGTQTFILSTTSGTQQIPHSQVSGGTIGVVSNLTNGTVRVSVGTISAFGASADIPGGTIDSITNVAFGTFNTFYRHTDEFSTTISTGTNTLGTIKAAVSGSVIYVTDLVISAGSATNVEVASGGTSTPILGTLHLAANGGAVMNFKTPIRTASGSALIYKQSTAVSPLSITVGGYVD